MSDGTAHDDRGKVEQLFATISGLEAAEDRLRLLLAASEILASSIDYETTLKNLPACLVPQFADGCVVDLVDDHRGLVRVAVTIADPTKAVLGERLKSLGPPNPDAPKGVLRIL